MAVLDFRGFSRVKLSRPQKHYFCFYSLKPEFTARLWPSRLERKKASLKSKQTFFSIKARKLTRWWLA